MRANQLSGNVERPRAATAAILCATGGPLELREVFIGPLRAGEVLVRLAGVGICHTDLAAIDGVVPLSNPVVLGHEGAGVVVECGAEVDSLAVGDHVVLSFDACRACPACSRGLPGYCDHARALNFGCVRPDGSTTLRSASGPVLDDVGFERAREPAAKDPSLVVSTRCPTQAALNPVVRVLVEDSTEQASLARPREFAGDLLESSLRLIARGEVEVPMAG